MWQYSTDFSEEWINIGEEINETSALFLDAESNKRFVPVADFQGTPGALSVRPAGTDVTRRWQKDIDTLFAEESEFNWSAFPHDKPVFRYRQ